MLRLRPAVGLLPHGAAHFGGALKRRHARVARRAPLAARPRAGAEPENAPVVYGGVVLALLARGAVRTRSGYTGVRRE